MLFSVIDNLGGGFFANALASSLAYVEMRLIMASILWHFDLELVPGQEDWLDQKIFLVWEKRPLMVRLKPVQR